MSTELRSTPWMVPFSSILGLFPVCNEQSRSGYLVGQVSFLEYISRCGYAKDILGARSIGRFRSWMSGLGGDFVLTLLEV